MIIPPGLELFLGIFRARWILKSMYRGVENRMPPSCFPLQPRWIDDRRRTGPCHLLAQSGLQENITWRQARRLPWSVDLTSATHLDKVASLIRLTNAPCANDTMADRTSRVRHLILRGARDADFTHRRPCTGSKLSMKKALPSYAAPNDSYAESLLWPSAQMHLSAYPFGRAR